MKVPFAWLVNDGEGGQNPVEGPTAAETPVAKGVDVDALLREAERRQAGQFFGAASLYLDNMPSVCTDALLHWVAAALRVERERAEMWLRLAQGAVTSRAHLRAVLDFMWPGGGGPTVVHNARAFLRGEEQAPVGPPTCTFCNEALEDQGFQGLADRVDEVQALRGHLAAVLDHIRDSDPDRTFPAERAALAHLAGKRTAPRSDDGAARWRAECEALRKDYEGRLRTMAAALEKAERELKVEDEAAAGLREQLATAIRCQNKATEERAKALAAQNRAQSEAAAARAELADLWAKIEGMLKTRGQ